MVSRHIGVVIRAPRDAVVAFARDPRNLPRWAAGLALGDIGSTEDGGLVLDSPMGRVTVVFAPANDFGVLDHDVTLPSGDVTNNPMRVLSHPDGAEVVFTVRQGDASDAQFHRDVALVEADLRRLSALLEG
ncbi:MAG: SRPBCC family protein [Acidobacteria bacterium]|nr:SRPBCC family protein [Acidobacteriota bacterium]